MAEFNVRRRRPIEEYFKEFNQMSFFYDDCFTSEEIAKMDTILRTALNGKKPNMRYFYFNVSIENYSLVFRSDYMTITIYGGFGDFRQNMRKLKGIPFKTADVEVVSAIMSAGDLLWDAFTMPPFEEKSEE